jgi:hypothetical protein
MVWGKLPAATKHWGEVGISMRVANQMFEIASHDPGAQRRIRINLLREDIEKHHTKAVTLQRKARRLQKRGENLVSAKRNNRSKQERGLELLEQAEKVSTEALQHKHQEDTAQAELTRVLEASPPSLSVDPTTLGEEEASSSTCESSISEE